MSSDRKRDDKGRAGEETGRYQVAEEHHRFRLDRFLSAIRPDLSRRTIDRLLRLGRVWVGGKPRDARYFVKKGQIVEWSGPDEDGEPMTGLLPDSRTIRAREEMPMHPFVILSTTSLLAIGKSPGMPVNPVHPGRPSLLDWAKAHASIVPGIVHRMDRDASGIVCFSLGPDAHRALRSDFGRRRIEKRYLALVAGRMSSKAGEIDLPLIRDASGRMHPPTKGDVGKAGLPALTRFRVLARRRDFSLLEVSPVTGRMHQIRVHLAASNHPILGDDLYGRPSRIFAPRLWLHAWSLEFPASTAALLQAPRRIACPLWADLARHARELGLPEAEEQG